MTAVSTLEPQVLEELTLSYNSIGDKSIDYIAEYIKVRMWEHSHHKHIIIYKWSSCIQATNCCLKTLDLSYTDIGPDGADKLSAALQVSPREREREREREKLSSLQDLSLSSLTHSTTHSSTTPSPLFFLMAARSVELGAYKLLPCFKLIVASQD